MDPRDKKISELEQKVEELSNALGQFIRMHRHEGVQSQRILLADVFGLIQVVDTAPTTVPQTMYDQIQIYSSGTVYRLYWYDWTNNAWRYAVAIDSAPFGSISTLQFTARNVTSLSAGQLAYHDNAGTQQFRAKAGTFFGSIDLTGV